MRGTKWINQTSIKIKNVWSAKDPVKKMKKQGTDWENLFANHICDKGLISKI